LLLSHIIPSYIIVPNKEVVNINFFTNNFTMSHSMDFNIVSEGIPRGRSNLSSSNLSRESLTHSDFSFVLYIDRMETYHNNLS